MKKYLILFLILGFIFSPQVFAKSVEDVYQEHLNGLKSMTDDQLREKFFYTEIVNNSIPQTIEFWTEAYCPFEDNHFSYTVPYDFDLVYCEKGDDGSHGGCPTCAMSKIKLKIKDIDHFYESFDFEYKKGEMEDIFKEFGITKEIKNNYYFPSSNKDFAKISKIRRDHYVEINNKKYGPYQEIHPFGSEEYPAFYYRYKNNYYAKIGNKILGPYNAIISTFYDKGGYLIFYKKGKEYFIDSNNKIEKILNCPYVNVAYNEGKYMYDCIMGDNAYTYGSSMYNLVIDNKLYHLGDAPNPNTEIEYLSEILVNEGKFIIPFFRYRYYQQFLYYEGMIFGSYDLYSSDFYIENNMLYFTYLKGDKEYLKIIEKIK